MLQMEDKKRVELTEKANMLKDMIKFERQSRVY